MVPFPVPLLPDVMVTQDGTVVLADHWQSAPDKATATLLPLLPADPSEAPEGVNPTWQP